MWSGLTLPCNCKQFQLYITIYHEIIFTCKILFYNSQIDTFLVSQTLSRTFDTIFLFFQRLFSVLESIMFRVAFAISYIVFIKFPETDQ